MDVCFLWHFPSSRLAWPLASTLSCEARTFLPQLQELPATTRPTPIKLDTSLTEKIEKKRENQRQVIF